MIFVPTTHKGCEASQHLSELGVEHVEIILDTDTDYFWLLQNLWRQQDDFTIVEHDITPSLDALAALDECPQNICLNSYEYFVGRYAGLGCARFRAATMVDDPHLWGRVALKSDAQHPKRHWCRLDGWMQGELRTRTKHIHDLPCGHSNQSAPSHGCA